MSLDSITQDSGRRMATELRGVMASREKHGAVIKAGLHEEPAPSITFRGILCPIPHPLLNILPA